VASLVATRTDDELRQLLVPALAYRIKACHESFHVWIRRWWRTGARFDSLDWAEVGGEYNCSDGILTISSNAAGSLTAL
jgi:hypothetical protein